MLIPSSGYRFCAYCGGKLTGRQRTYDSPECAKKAKRAAWVLSVYGITMDEFEGALAFQGNRCAICDKPFTGTPHIDHEHGGHVRGLVCSYCNTRLIGRLKSHALAQRLADYLRDPPMVRFIGEPRIAPGRPKKKRRRKPK